MSQVNFEVWSLDQTPTKVSEYEDAEYLIVDYGQVTCPKDLFVVYVNCKGFVMDWKDTVVELHYRHPVFILYRRKEFDSNPAVPGVPVYKILPV